MSVFKLRVASSETLQGSTDIFGKRIFDLTRSLARLAEPEESVEDSVQFAGAARIGT